jgi:hypothetical protein
MNGEDDTLPPEIEARLRHDAERMAVLVPPAVDQAILFRAQERFTEIRRRRSRVKTVWWMSAAACFVALAFLASSLINAPRFERADVDQSGRVDILDAFALARRIQQGTAGGFDLNRDGVVDKLDVDLVAAQAVRLRKESA